MDQGAENESSSEPRQGRVTELAEAYAHAVLSGDEVAAEIVIREAMDADLSTGEIDERLIAPALWLVGELWERGEISVADEHVATEITVRVLALQREAQRVVRSRSQSRVLLATPSGERHVVALQMVANLLRDAGYEVVMLGADVPANTLGAVARRHGAAAICMSLTMPGGMEHMLRAINEVRQQLPAVGLVIGGRGLTADGHLGPQVHPCRRVSEAVEAVDAIIKRAALN
jgi:MerR family transcriptional regulator, light-induced transcriptional regulator